VLPSASAEASLDFVSPTSSRTSTASGFASASAAASSGGGASARATATRSAAPPPPPSQPPPPPPSNGASATPTVERLADRISPVTLRAAGAVFSRSTLKRWKPRALPFSSIGGGAVGAGKLLDQPWLAEDLLAIEARRALASADALAPPVAAGEAHRRLSRGAPEVPVAVVTAHEETALIVADVFVFASVNASVARAVLLDAGAALVTFPGMGTNSSGFPALAPTARPVGPTMVPPTGVEFRAVRVGWTLRGLPALPPGASGVASAATPPRNAAEGRGEAFHVVELSSASFVTTVPPGTLRPGYV
jgi:hypothetical protein